MIFLVKFFLPEWIGAIATEDIYQRSQTRKKRPVTEPAVIC